MEKNLAKTQKKEGGELLLHNAAKEGRYELCEELLKVGVNPNFKNEKGETALHQAALGWYGETFGGGDKTLSILLNSGAKLEEKTNNGETPLFVATAYNNKNCIKFLLDAGANPNMEKKETGLTPFLLACSNCDEDIIKEMIDHGADKNKKCRLGMLPLHWASLKGTLKTIEMLLTLDKTVINTKDINGETPLHKACSREIGRKDIVRLLIDANANVLEKNNDNKPPLDLSKKNKHIGVASIIEKNYKKHLTKKIKETITNDLEL